MVYYAMCQCKVCSVQSSVFLTGMMREVAMRGFLPQMSIRRISTKTGGSSIREMAMKLWGVIYRGWLVAGTGTCCRCSL